MTSRSLAAVPRVPVPVKGRSVQLGETPHQGCGTGRRAAVADLLAVFLEDFLKQNGYHDVTDAITDTVRAAMAPDIPTASAPNVPELTGALET